MRAYNAQGAKKTTQQKNMLGGFCLDPDDCGFANMSEKIRNLTAQQRATRSRCHNKGAGITKLRRHKFASTKFGACAKRPHAFEKRIQAHLGTRDAVAHDGHPDARWQER